MNVKVSTELAMPADVAWQTVQRSDTLVYVNRGVLGFRWLTSQPEKWRAGDDVRVRLLFFNVLPAWTHTLRFAAIDNHRRTILTRENGGPVKVWNHRIRIEPIDASLAVATRMRSRFGRSAHAFVALFAHTIYRYRQWRWRRIARGRSKRVGHS